MPNDLRNAVPCGCLLVAHEKDGKRYGMCCSWAMQVNVNELLLAIGGQSATGRALEVGDRVGVTVLAKDQVTVALGFGMKSSADADKFEGLDGVLVDGAALTLAGGVRRMVGELLGKQSIDTEGYTTLHHVKLLEVHEDGGEPLLLDDVLKMSGS